MKLNEKGVTLVELLAGLAILSLILIIYLNISNYNRHAQIKGELSHQALLVAENIANELRSAENPQQLITSYNTGQLNVEPFSVRIDSQVLKSEQKNYEFETSEDKSTSLSLYLFYRESPQQVRRPHLVTITVSWEGNYGK